jgi:1-acyl-sn-glycerol-3-phosphate acyltransferase
MAAARAAGLLAFLLPFTLLAIAVQWAALRLNLHASRTIPRLYHRSVCRLMGARIKVIGTPVKGGVLFAANHSGWLDIIVLSTVQPLSFIAKDEIAGWPLFGLMSKLQRTIFVRRGERSKVAEDRDVIRSRLLAGDALVIFPEGTSTDGNRVRSFKSSLFGAAELPLGEDEAHHVQHPRVQPVTVAYTGLHGMPMGRENRPFFAWYGDMDLVPHLWGAFAAGPIDVVIEFHRPLTIDEAGGRKQLAAAAERAVQAGLARALHGKPLRAVPDAVDIADLAPDDEKAAEPA